ncbi:MAG: RNA methyltransferase [Clostridia bacterium]|nr:RNA methyltransferase [Clostridia bacterium]
MQVISSKDNEIVKHVKKLSEKKYRDQMQEYLIEGIKLIEEAIQEKAVISKIIICEECTKNLEISKNLMYEIAKYECIYVTEKIFKSLSQVTNPQGILAIIKKEPEKLKIEYNDDIIVALDDIQDPGNLGTILRTVDSVGLNQIIVTKGTADVYNPKVVRSTMGAIFRVKVIEVEDLEESIKEMQKNGFKLMVTSLQTDKTIYDVDYNKKIIVIGNEANGVAQNIQKLANERVIIPMLGKTESLNASVATGIILYEYVRNKVK